MNMTKKQKTGTAVGAPVGTVASQGDMLKQKASSILDAVMKLGALRGMQYLAQTNRLQTVRLFIDLEDSGAWRELPGDPSDPNGPPCATFKEAAAAWLGRSYRSLAEDRQNLDTLGEQYFALCESLPRAVVRQLRSLPAAAREDLLSADGVEDHKALKAKIEVLAAELDDAKEDAEEKITAAEYALKDARGDLEAARAISADRNQRITELEVELEKFQRGAVPAEARARLLIEATHKYGDRVERALRELLQVPAHVLLVWEEERLKEDYDRATVEQAALAISHQMRRIAHRVADIQEQIYGGLAHLIPERVIASAASTQDDSASD